MVHFILRQAYCLLPVILLAACAGTPQETNHDETIAYREPHRPQFHFSPPDHWMNDPNGLVYFENEYHLFYQHYPDSNVWGPMHWGHAVSTDLVHWTNLPIALYPDTLGMIFSGSAVIDHNNTTGFGKPGQPAMVAIFTYHNMAGEKAGHNDFQHQGIAYSLDKGRTWTKYEGNPVLKNPGKRDFRDPKVRWHEPSSQWIMTLAVRDHLELYGSADLKTWQLLSNFHFDNNNPEGVWECPDLFELPVEGTNEKKWVLFVSVNNGAPNGGTGTFYFTGHFNGKEFTPDKPEFYWIDYGKDNYAGVTWSNVPAQDGRTLFLGWMSNWQYGQVVPTDAWRSAMTVPRSLSLVQTAAGIRLASNPVRELGALRQSDGIEQHDLLSDGDSVSREIVLPGNLVEITLEVERSHGASSIELELYNSKNQKVLIGLDGPTNQFYIDRRRSGKIDFAGDFPGRHTAPRFKNTDLVTLTLFIDVASAEVFADDGTLVMTEIFFPDEAYNRLKVRSATGGSTVRSCVIYPLAGIWH